VKLSGPVTALTFRSDGKRFAAGVTAPEKPGETGAVRIEVVTEQEGSEPDNWLPSSTIGLPAAETVRSLAISPDGLLLVAGTATADGKGGGLRVWDRVKLAPQPAAAPAPWRERAVLTDMRDSVFSVAFSPDGKAFAAGGEWLGTGAEWHFPSLQRQALYTRDDVHTDPAAVAYSPDGQTRVTTFRDGASWANQRGLLTPPGTLEKGSIPRAVAYGPFGEMVEGKKLNRLAFTDGRAVWVKTWFEDAPVGTAKFGPLADAPKINGPLPAAVAFSPDGKQLVFIPNSKIDPANPVGKQDPAKATHWFAQVWGGGSGAPMVMLPHGTAAVTAVAWSPDGKLVATGGADGTVILWDAATFKEARRVRFGTGVVHGLAFAPDGRKLAAAVAFEEGRNPHRVVLLDPVTGERVEELTAFPHTPPRAVAFSPDGKTLVVGCGALPADRPRDYDPNRDWSKYGAVHVFTTEPAR
jgi:WD40 repeat protein